jgi:hypothetical protein
MINARHDAVVPKRPTDDDVRFEFVGLQARCREVRVLSHASAKVLGRYPLDDLGPSAVDGWRRLRSRTRESSGPTGLATTRLLTKSATAKDDLHGPRPAGGATYGGRDKPGVVEGGDDGPGDGG